MLRKIRELFVGITALLWLIDQNNKVVWRNEGEPFGNAVPDEDPDKDGKAFTLNLRFPGQYYDKETGRNQNYYRDYNPETGRYIESDPIGLAGGVNTFGYVGGNPLSYVDPLGLIEVKDHGPNGKDGQIMCNGSKMEVTLPSQDDFNKMGFTCPAIRACVIAHEKVHIIQSIKQNLVMCVGNVGQHVIGASSVPEQKQMENQAFEVTLQCLRAIESKPCAEGDKCKAEAQRLIKLVKEAVENVDSGHYGR